MIDTGTRQHTVTGLGIEWDPNESFGLRPERFFRRKMPSDHFFKSTESFLEHRNAVPEMRPVVCFGENLRGDQHVKPPPAGGDVGVQIRDACRQVESDAGEKRLASVGSSPRDLLNALQPAIQDDLNVLRQGADNVRSHGDAVGVHSSDATIGLPIAGG